MTVLFAGGDLSAFAPSSTADVTEVTTAGTFDATYARSSMQMNNGVGTITSPAYTAVTTHWFHGELKTASANRFNNIDIVIFYNSVGTAVFKLNSGAGNGAYQMMYWNGASWTNIGSAIPALAGGALYTIDIKVVCGASGSAEMYVSGTLQASGAGAANMSNCNNIAKVQPRIETSSGNTNNWSQIICADEPTVGWKLAERHPTGNSATNTAWTNDFAAVDEATTVDDTDFITSSAAGDIETYTGNAAANPAGLAVKALAVCARLKVPATGPQNCQAALRIGGTNYFSANLTGLTSGFGPAVALFATDPSTSAAWASIAAANAAEFGLKSAA